MNLSPNRRCSAFVGHRRIAAGALHFVAQDVKKQLGDDAQTAIIIDNSTSEVIEVDFRGDAETIAQQFVAETPEAPNAEPAPKPDNAKRSRGRPKLGVVAREVTLLPQHWDWLNQQPGGASVTLRKLVLQAKRQAESADTQRQAQTAVYRFMTIVSPGLAEYEEALRALYAKDTQRFSTLIESWPVDVKTHIKKLALPAFPAQSNATDLNPPQNVSSENTSFKNKSLKSKPDTTP